MKGNKITEKRREDLEFMKKQLSDLENSIQKILNNECSMTEFANTLGISPQDINLCSKKGAYYLLNKIKIASKEDIESLLVKSMSPGERLIRAILETDELLILDIVEEEKLIKIMEEALISREFDVLGYRYGFIDGKPRSLDYTANAYCVSTERIRQIEAKAIRKLRNPKWIKAMLPGYDLKVKALQDLKEMKSISDDIDTQIANMQEVVVNSAVNVNADLPLIELGVSVRAYNCMIRNPRIPLTTIGDLAKLTTQDLMRFRNCGRMTVVEIVKAAAKYGIEIRDNMGIIK